MDETRTFIVTPAEQAVLAAAWTVERLKERAEALEAKSRISMEEKLAKLEEAVAEGKKTAAKTRVELLGKLEKARSTEA